jgi:hypothetical protein
MSRPTWLPVELPTPDEFTRMSDSEKDDAYRQAVQWIGLSNMMIRAADIFIQSSVPAGTDD